MKKLTLLIWVCLAVVTLAQLAGAQEATIRNTAATSTASDRQQDGLNGPVRRVRLETAKMVIKDGQLIEGPRAVQRVTTYDVNGRKIDTQASPTENSPPPPGKRQYGYDKKGNIVEMIARGEDGSVLSKEIYQYEFDDLGNWKKMTISVAVYEDGKVSFEPTQVIYRGIAYYYGQAVEKMTAASASTPGSVSAPNVSPVPNKTVSSSPKTNAGEPKTSRDDTVVRVGADGNRVGNHSTPASGVSSAPADSEPAENIAIKTVEQPAPSQVSPSTTPVTNLSEGAPRGTANNMPQAESPSAAQPNGSKGRADAEVEPVALKSAASPAKRDTVATSSTPPAVSSASGVSTENADRFYRQGVSHLRAGQYRQAVNALRQAVYLNPEDALAYSKLGVAYVGLEEYKDAVAVLKLAIRIKPKVVDAEAYYRLGEAYTTMDKHSEALKAFKQAMYISRAQVLESDPSKYAGIPPMAELHYGVGLAYNNLGGYRDALKEFKLAIELRADFAEAYYGMAMAHIALDDRKTAEKEEKILRPLNANLADRVAAAINRAGDVLPGVTGAKRRP